MPRLLGAAYLEEGSAPGELPASGCHPAFGCCPYLDLVERLETEVAVRGCGCGEVTEPVGAVSAAVRG